MSLEKALTQDHLTADTVDAQFCNNWLKEQIKRLFAELIITRQERDAHLKSCSDAAEELKCAKEELKWRRAFAKLVEPGLEFAVPALLKIYDPKKYHHDEPDDYTRLACAQFIAQEALKELGVLNALGSEVKAGEQTTQGDAPPPSDHAAGAG